MKTPPADAGDTRSIAGPTCHGAAKPVCRNYWGCALEPRSSNWAQAPRACAPQQEKPPKWEICSLQLKSNTHLSQLGESLSSNKDPERPKKKNFKKKSFLRLQRQMEQLGFKLQRILFFLSFLSHFIIFSLFFFFIFYFFAACGVLVLWPRIELGPSAVRAQSLNHWTAEEFRRRQWHPTPVLLPGESHGWRSLVGCSPWGRTELDTTEVT